MADPIGSDLLKDPLLLSIVAGQFGAGLSDPGSFGASVGATTADVARGIKFAEASTKAQAERKEFMDALLRVLSGGFTPKEEAGPTSMKMTPEGVSLDISAPSFGGQGTSQLIKSLLTEEPGKGAFPF